VWLSRGALLLLISASTGLLLDAAAGPLYSGDALVGDDSFGSHAHLALLLRDELHGLFPVHHARIVDFTPGRAHFPEHAPVSGVPRSRWVKSLGRDDQLVEWFKPGQWPKWIDAQTYAALPASIAVRELRRTVRGPAGNRVTLTMVTTLLDPRQYPADGGDGSLLDLRLRRWGVETDIRHLKSTMRLGVLRCKSEAGVRKELAVFCLVYNLVRVTMLEAARRQEVSVSRISFADAYR
jgi:hypothetical protein